MNDNNTPKDNPNSEVNLEQKAQTKITETENKKSWVHFAARIY